MGRAHTQPTQSAFILPGAHALGHPASRQRFASHALKCHGHDVVLALPAADERESSRTVRIVSLAALAELVWVVSLFGLTVFVAG